MLDEVQSLYAEDPEGAFQHIRLYLSCCDKDLQEKFRKFMEMYTWQGAVYEAEFQQDDQYVNDLKQVGAVHPLYDMMDVCVKSKNVIKNPHVLNFDRSTDVGLAKTEDLYLPASAKVTGFGQVGQNVYLLTDRTTDGCDRLSSTIYAERGSRRTRSGYNMQLNHDGLKTYLYPSLQQLNSALNEAGVSEKASSLREGLNFYQTALAARVFGRNSTNDYFNPAAQLAGIGYNYVAQAPACYVKSKYGNGNVYADLFHAKNAYDATYQMDVPNELSVRNCREYLDVYECGGKIYLKYYDRANYSVAASTNKTAYQLSAVEGRKAEQQERGWPYQKIETFFPIGSRTGNRHKSLFFSINIADVYVEGDDDASVGESDLTADERKLLNDIKFDITASIKEIARNVCPANTQLFEVYFGTNS